MAQPVDTSTKTN